MITELRIQDGATHLSDGNQLTFVVDGSNLERIWRDWDRYLDLLYYKEAKDSDRLAAFIQLSYAVNCFYRDREWKAGGTTPASRRDHLLALEASLYKTISGIRGIDARTKEFIDDESFSEFEEDYFIDDLTRRLQFLRGEVSKWAEDDSEVKIGNNADTGLQELIANLALIFQAFSLKKASKPHMRASKKDDHDQNPYDGPFYRFCVAVLEEIEPAEIPRLPHAIKAALKAG